VSPRASGASQVEALRRAFDQSFRAPPPGEEEETEDLLQLRIGGQALAVRLSEIAGLIQGRTPVPLPAAAPGLLGLAGIRGALWPVFDLAVLLGEPPAQDPRWLLLCGAGAPVALAFSLFEGHLRLARSVVNGAAPASGLRILSIPHLVASLQTPEGDPP